MAVSMLSQAYVRIEGGIAKYMSAPWNIRGHHQFGLRGQRRRHLHRIFDWGETYHPPGVQGTEFWPLAALLIDLRPLCVALF